MKDIHMNHLTSFKNAVSAENYEAATEALKEIHESYEETEDSVESKRADAARRTPEIDVKQAVTLQEFSGAHSRTRLTRGTFLANAALFLANPSELDAEQIIHLADQLIDQESQLSAKQDKANQALSSVTVPPSVEVIDLEFPEREITVGSSFSLTVTVANVGDELASGVTIGLETSGGTTVTPTSIDVGSLAGGDRIVEAATVHADESGEQTLGIELISDNAGSGANQRTFEVTVPVQLITVSLNGLATVAELITKTTSLPRHAKRPLLVLVEQAAEQAVVGGEALQDGELETVNEQIDNTIETLESLNDEFRAMTEGPSAVCDPNAFEFRQSVKRQLDIVVDRLNDTKEEVIQ